MRLFSSLLTFSLLHSVGLVSGRDVDADGLDWDAEIPRPTPEPLLYRDEFKRGPLLMETNLGYPRNGTLRREHALGARGVCDRHGPRDSINAAVSIFALLAMFIHVHLQNNPLAAPRMLLYVVSHSKLGHCSTPFRRYAVRVLFQLHAAAQANSASALGHVVLTAKSAALTPRVGHLIYLFSPSF
jgi:hypothetical protein